MTERRELEPCPFCWGTNLTVENAGTEHEYVVCEDCGAFGPDAGHETAWNARATRTPPTGYVMVPVQEHTQMKAAFDELERHRPIMELYDRVHEDLDDGKEWSDVDHGLRIRGDEKPLTYENWLAYMRQRVINGMRSAMLAAASEKGEGKNAVGSLGWSISDEIMRACDETEKNLVRVPKSRP